MLPFFAVVISAVTVSEIPAMWLESVLLPSAVGVPSITRVSNVSGVLAVVLSLGSLQGLESLLFVPFLLLLVFKRFSCCWNLCLFCVPAIVGLSTVVGFPQVACTHAVEKFSAVAGALRLL